MIFFVIILEVMKRIYTFHVFVLFVFIAPSTNVTLLISLLILVVEHFFWFIWQFYNNQTLSLSTFPIFSRSQ